MCVSFYVDPNDEEMLELILEAQRSHLYDRFLQAGNPFLSRGAARPTNVVAALAPNRSGEIGVFPMKWGFQLPGRSLLINARSESAARKPTFRSSWVTRRCIIPASCYFDWEHIKTPDGKTKTGEKFAIRPQGESLTWLCGLYRFEEGFPAFTVLTREPGEALRKIHNRMPLILPKADLSDWLDPHAKPEDLLPRALTDLIAEKAG